MSDAAFIYSDSYQGYDFGPWHPMKPERLKLTAELIREYGVCGRRPECEILEPLQATEEDLALVHEPAYIDKVRELSEPAAGGGAATAWGLGTGDNPVFPRMHEAAATIAGASLLGASRIAAGEITHAFNVAGGLHHAQPARASGFCIYNDVAIAIAWLRRHHDLRVVYLDVDAHHGDGVQQFFYHDPEVMTISFHESGRTLFPGTGFPEETGGGAAAGTSVNLPLAPLTGDGLLLNAFDELVPPLVAAFGPDILVTQCGVDGHFNDPLTHLAYTLKGFRQIWRRLHRLAHRFTGGRWLAAGGGGYQAYSVVPRAWTALMAEMSDFRLAEALPEPWRELCRKYAGGPVPETITGERPPAVDEAALQNAAAVAAQGINALKRSVFPLMGAS